MISKEKIKYYQTTISKNEDKIIIAIGFVLVAVLSFGAGKLSETYHTQTPIIFQDCSDCQSPQGSSQASPEITASPASEAQGKIIGNKNSHIYHLPGDAFYDKISPENRIYFATEEEAQKAGYRKSKS